MIVRNHDREGDSRTNDLASVIEHGEMDVEPRLLAMVPTVACNAKRKDNRPRREIQHFRAVELDELGRVFVLPAPRYGEGFFGALIVRARWSDARSKLPLDALRLRPWRSVGERSYVERPRTSRAWQLVQQVTFVCGGEAQVISVVKCRVSSGIASATDKLRAQSTQLDTHQFFLPCESFALYWSPLAAVATSNFRHDHT